MSRIFERASMSNCTDDMRSLSGGFRPPRSRKRSCTRNVCSGRVGSSYTVVKVFVSPGRPNTATLDVNSLILGYCRCEVALPLALSTTDANHLQQTLVEMMMYAILFHHVLGSRARKV